MDRFEGVSIDGMICGCTGSEMCADNDGLFVILV